MSVGVVYKLVDEMDGMVYVGSCYREDGKQFPKFPPHVAAAVRERAKTFRLQVLEEHDDVPVAELRDRARQVLGPVTMNECWGGHREKFYNLHPKRATKASLFAHCRMCGTEYSLVPCLILRRRHCCNECRGLARKLKVKGNGEFKGIFRHRYDGVDEMVYDVALNPVGLAGEGE